MAIQTEFIDFIVNISAIRAKYPGGWEQCLEDHANLIGGRVWYDEYLFRDGAMNPHDIGRLVDHWSSLGLIGRARVVTGAELEVVTGAGLGVVTRAELESRLAPSSR